MKKITLTIPTYNSSQYLNDCLKYSIDNEFIGEIVINDDFSSEENYYSLLSIVEKLDTNKIKVYRNQCNLGAFRNKYIAVDKSNYEWIYLLDSDNHPFQDTYDILKTIDQGVANICYSPSKLYCKHDGDVDYSAISDYNNFGYDLIGIEESKDALIKRKKWFDWFINTGNYFFNRNFYLESLKDPFENFSQYKLFADTAASFYFMLKNNGQFKIIPNLCHNHRLRKDSYWNTCGFESQATVDLYKNMILDL
jgi:glycosyltransferase involved in cell wall biosynthesis